MRDEFIFSASYKIAIDQAVEQGLATNEDKLAWYDGIINYALFDIEPQFKGICAILWNLAMVSINKDNIEYDRLQEESARAAVKSEQARKSVSARYKCKDSTNVDLRTYTYERRSTEKEKGREKEEKKKEEKEFPEVSLSPTPPNTSLLIEKEINKEKEKREIDKEKEGVQGEREETSPASNGIPVRAVEERLTQDFLKKVVDMWNTTCTPQLPKLIDIKGSRREKFRLRLMELGKDKKEADWLEWLRQLFEKVARTPFLHGQNNTGWKCDFEWLITNDHNWKKVMEGKYDGTPDLGYDTGVILRNDPHKWDNITEENFWDH